MNVKSLITKDYRKKDDFAVQKNKPNSNPIKPNFKPDGYREGFDMGQIAEILCIPEGTVKSRLHRMLEKLRQLMG